MNEKGKRVIATKILDIGYSVLDVEYSDYLYVVYRPSKK